MVELVIGQLPTNLAIQGCEKKVKLAIEALYDIKVIHK
jgi:hypothetical protein